MDHPGVTEGFTGDLDYLLKTDGAVFALEVGDTVSLILKTQEGRLIDTAGNMAVVDAPTGRVRYTPDAGDFRAKDSPYLLRIKVVRATRVLFFPNGQPDTLPVWAP